MRVLCGTILKKVLLIEHLFVSAVWDERFYFALQTDRIAGVETKRFNFPDTVPLVQLENGAVRVRNSRVTLETIVHCMQMGDTEEEIHDSFPTVSVSLIKEILAWYFDNKEEADEYLQQVEALAERLRKWAESQPGYKERHEKLLRCKVEILRQREQS